VRAAGWGRYERAGVRSLARALAVRRERREQRDESAPGGSVVVFARTVAWLVCLVASSNTRFMGLCVLVTGL
jgi:hypothetical protein